MITTRSSGKSSISRGPDEHAVGDLDVAERRADAHVLAHRAPDQRHLAIERRGRVDDLLDAVDVRREARDHDPSLAVREHLLQVRAHDRLRGREARAVDVRRVSAQQQHALAAELGQARDVRRRAVHGRLVELVVARDQHRAERSVPSATALESGIEWVMWTSSIENGPSSSVSAMSTSFSSMSRSLCSSSFERAIAIVSAPPYTGGRWLSAELAQDPRQRAEMVLVAVGHDDRLDVLGPLAQVGEVGQDQVDADHLRGREAQAHVHHHDAPVVLDDRHVLAYLPQPAEGQDAQ